MIRLGGRMGFRVPRRLTPEGAARIIARIGPDELPDALALFREEQLRRGVVDDAVEELFLAGEIQEENVVAYLAAEWPARGERKGARYL